MSEQTDQGITRLTVAGYKSISREQSIAIRPLTLLAGANSAGKSSMVQPLLLLKQTLEVSYDPGPLLLNGPNVQFSSLRELLSRGSRGGASAFTVGVGFDHAADLTLTFARIGAEKSTETDTLALTRMSIVGSHNGVQLTPEMDHDAIIVASSPELRQQMQLALAREMLHLTTGDTLHGDPRLKVMRRRCFLDISVVAQVDWNTEHLLSILPLDILIEPAIRTTIHLPGLRDWPERMYPVSATGPQFPGTFQQYVASVIAGWQAQGRRDLLDQLATYLADLNLTRTIEAHVRDSSRIDLLVDRMPVGSSRRASDMVNIADVGISVSQTLPVLVALLAAAPGQLVIIEQPELHLHLSAQVQLARVLADAALRGVRVIVETHSSLLLLSVQTLVAQGHLPPELVQLHWFDRDAAGVTTVASANLDATGAFGDWPVTFDTVELDAQRHYLDAAEARQAGQSH